MKINLDKYVSALGIALLCLLWAGVAGAQTWAPLTHTITGGAAADSALLLTDGSVLVHQNCSRNWYKLTPDNQGSYINGTWSAAIPMQAGYGPLFFASAVLGDGRVVATGGEYNVADGCANGVDTNLAAIYDPATNAWSALPSPPFTGANGLKVGDAQSVVLPNGKWLVAHLFDTQIAQLDPATLTWTLATSTGKADIHSEEGWNLLPNGTVLTVDSQNGTQSEIYNPSTGAWALAGSTIASLPNNGGLNIVPEVGPAVLRPDGTVYATGSSGHNAVYTVSSGTWAASADFPVVGVQQLVADGPAALLPSGNVLVVTSAFFTNTTNGSPAHFFEFNGTTPTPTAATPHAPSLGAYQTRMLLLPTGQVLLTDGTNDVEIYTPASTAPGNNAWRPVISIAPATVLPGTTHSISGLQFNGLSQAVAYGDDAQAATNYPLVRITNTGTGHVFYTHTHDHSTMAVATDGSVVSTNFDVPASVELGPSTLVVVANGIPSLPFAIDVGLTPPSISKSFTPATIQVGASSILTFTITNPNASPLTGVAFADTLPAGVTVFTSSVPQCGGTLTTTSPGTIALSGATVAASGQCQFSVSVAGFAPGIWTNVTGNVKSGQSIDGNQATAILTVVSPPTISKSFAAPKKVIPGGIIALSFTVGNPNSFAALPGLGFTDSLPGALVVATPNGLTGSCDGGTITATAGSNKIILANATLAASTSCTFSVNVTAPSDGIFVNTTGAVFSTYGSGGTATDTLFVATPPRLSKSFGGILTLLPGGSTGLAFNLTNPNSVVTLNGLAFSDTLPAGLLVSTPNGLVGSCDGGTITAIPGTNLVTLTGASLAAGASCTFTVNVTAAAFELGLLTNTTSTVTSNEALPGASASDSIFVGNPFQVRSASNLPIGDSVVNATDTGTSSTTAFPTQNGNICLNVYTFSPDEQLISCCTCPVTPDGLDSLSARNDLISNTLTPGVPTSIVIKLLASTGPTCNASTVGQGANGLATGLAAWGTTIHALPVTPGSPATTYGVTETPFRPSTLSTAELTRITTLCGFIQTNGSGFGICKSCRLGGLANTQ